MVVVLFFEIDEEDCIVVVMIKRKDSHITFEERNMADGRRRRKERERERERQ